MDWIGLSFVRSARDIIELKGIIHQRDKHARVVAKIEKPEALLEIDEIIRESRCPDGGPGRPRRGDPDGEGAVGAEGHHPPLPGHSTAR